MTMHVDEGILLPASVLASEWFSVLAAFVAVNTLIYVTLAIGKMLPRVHPGDLLHRRRQPADGSPRATPDHTGDGQQGEQRP